MQSWPLSLIYSRGCGWYCTLAQALHSGFNAEGELAGLAIQFSTWSSQQQPQHAHHGGVDRSQCHSTWAVQRRICRLQ